MSWIKMINPEEADDNLRPLYDEMISKGGSLDHVLQVSGLMPGVLSGFYELYLELMWKPGALQRREREMVAVTVSALNDCHY